MTPQQQQHARNLLGSIPVHDGELAELSVWRYPPDGLWARWVLVMQDSRYWVRRGVAQRSGDTVVLSVAEASLTHAVISPLFSGVSRMTMPLVPLEDSELPQPGTEEVGLTCGALRLAWAHGRLTGPWAPFATLAERLIACFEDALPPTSR